MPQLQTSGTLDSSVLYIERPEDARLFEILQRGVYVNLLTSRQMGKSSPIARTPAKLEAEGTLTASIDLAGILGSPDTADAYYLGLLEEIAEQLGLVIDVEAWWQETRAATANQKLRRFFVDVVAGRNEGTIVIALDEIDSTLKLLYTDDLFVAIRGMHNDRQRIAPLRRITFCLIGVATPNELIKDRRTTPYNIGETLGLSDFDPCRDDLSALRIALHRDPATAQALLNRVLHWTGGQPYLTVRACDDLISRLVTNIDEVDAYVQTTFAGLSQLSRDAHIDYILRFVDQRLTDSGAILSLYNRIILGESVLYSQTLAHAELKLSGLVRSNSNGRLRVANEIYGRLFNRAWVDSQASGLERVGAAREAVRDLTGASQAYREGLEIAEQLLAIDPGNADRRRDVLLLYNTIGDLLVEQGQHVAALDSYRASVAIAERLAEADPGSAGWQRDLCDSHTKMGDILRAQGELAAAIESYQASLGIAELLAEADPDNARLATVP